MRIDGWRFHKVSEELRLNRPFDERLIKVLSQVPVRLMKMGFPLALSFLFSDEISFLIYPPIPWDGRVEKLISVIPSYSSAIVSTLLNYPACFDARIVTIRNLEDILDYLSWRQSEAWRNALNSYALLALENSGLRREDAVKELKGKKAEQLHDIIFNRLGINVAKVPSWQRRGVIVRKGYEEKGSPYKRIVRKVPLIDWEVPLFSTAEGREYLMESLKTYEGNP
ncbi:MAG: tRNA(His) guanylyltransferase Thg1 family protein [Candidatus Korarchaeum sp.]|nr:tRNA(His) guanylyltransferase Thg1 family protein [Candidatus Korarchaeum sp.]